MASSHGWTPEQRATWDYLAAHPEGVTARVAAQEMGGKRDAVRTRLENLSALRFARRVLGRNYGEPAVFFPESSPPDPPAASVPSTRPKRRPKWTGPIHAVAQQAPASASPGTEPALRATPAAPAPIHESQRAEFLEWLQTVNTTESKAESNILNLPAREAVPTKPITSQVYTGQVRPAFVPNNNRASDLTTFLCKIDDSHGPETSPRGYCARCERLYGPLA